MTIPLKMQTNFPLICGVLMASIAGAGKTWGQASAPDGTTAVPVAPPVVITLDEAIHRTQSSDENYTAAVGARRSAALDRNISYGDLLPSAVYHNQGLYTQPNGQTNQAGQGVTSQP